jgi:hypothetical protein
MLQDCPATCTWELSIQIYILTCKIHLRVLCFSRRTQIATGRLTSDLTASDRMWTQSNNRVSKVFPFNSMPGSTGSACQSAVMFRWQLYLLKYCKRTAFLSLIAPFCSARFVTPSKGAPPYCLTYLIISSTWRLHHSPNTNLRFQSQH